MTDEHIKHIKKVKSASGSIYFYDRISGARLKNWPDTGSPNFLAELASLRSGSEAPKRDAAKVETFGDLVRRYKESDSFNTKAQRTRRDYLKVLDYLKPLDGVALSDFDGPYVSEIKTRAYKRHKRRFANYVLAVLSVLFNWGREPGYTSANPTEQVKKILRPKDAVHVNRPWSDDELEAALREAEPYLAIAIAIGVYTGMREGDMLVFPLSGIGPETIRFQQGKTGEWVEMPIDDNLRPYLALPIKRDDVTVVVGKRGRSLTESGFRGVFFKFIRSLEAQGLVKPGLTFHGLRHTVGTRLAELNGTDAQIQAMLGHQTPAQAQTYRRGADMAKGARSAVLLLRRSKSAENSA
jgi:integrase